MKYIFAFKQVLFKTLDITALIFLIQFIFWLMGYKNEYIDFLYNLAVIFATIIIYSFGWVGYNILSHSDNVEIVVEEKKEEN